MTLSVDNPKPQPAVRSTAEQSAVELAVRQLFEKSITFNETLGLKVHTFSDTPSIRFDMRSELVGHYVYGRLHGGVISTALDSTGGFAIMCGLCAKFAGDSVDQIMMRFSKLGTIDLHIDYLRPGIGEHFIASAQTTRLGGRIGSTLMQLHNNQGLLIATGSANYIVS